MRGHGSPLLPVSASLLLPSSLGVATEKRNNLQTFLLKVQDTLARLDKSTSPSATTKEG
jgi:hypothetical protein